MRIIKIGLVDFNKLTLLKINKKCAIIKKDGNYENNYHHWDFKINHW
jgi:hypothetical protein